VKDQAAMLRQLMAAERRPEPPEPGGPGAIVVGSGKGGVGKTLIAIGLAHVLAAEDRRVLLVEGNQDLSDLPILLGVRPAGRLEDLLDDRRDPAHLITPVHERLSLLPGDSGAEALYGLGPTERARLHRRLSTLYARFDAVVVDGGSGIESIVRAATMRAQRLLVVVTPEPASLSDGYALIKVMSAQVRGLPIDVVVNRALDDDEAQLAFDKLRMAADRFLRRTLDCIAVIPEDEAMRGVSRVHTPLFGPEPAGPAAVAIRRLARTILREERAGRPAARAIG
jgi:flagellar biosynthesis protein FlhG